MSLTMPEPLGIDTDMSGVGSGTMLDAPDIDELLPVSSVDNFRTQMQSSTMSGFAAQMQAMNGDMDSSGKATGTRGQIVDFAKQYLGMMYKWGGSNPNTSFDCSGFTQYVLGKFGVHIPRVSYQQANAGKRTALGALQPGDLVAWDNSSRNNGADHVALYIGNGQIMEFYSTGHASRIRKVRNNEGAFGVHINY